MNILNSDMDEFRLSYNSTLIQSAMKYKIFFQTPSVLSTEGRRYNQGGGYYTHLSGVQT